MAHPHAHVPHELTEAGEAHEPPAPGRRERRLELTAVLLLALAALLTAWCGYQAALWSGEQSQRYSQASTTRIHSQREATQAGQLRIGDLLLFNGWLNARDNGRSRLAAVYERRFRSEFVPAYRAWLAQRPFTNPHAAPSPLFVPQYRLAGLDRATALDHKADDLYAEGTRAKTKDDDYILSTVFFAAVLFFSGVSLRLDWRPLRVAVLAMAGVMLLGGAIFVLTLPVA